MGLNNDLINIFNREIVLLEKYQNICYEIYDLGEKLKEKQADEFLNELMQLYEDNAVQYNAFINWHKKLVSYRSL